MCVKLRAEIRFTFSLILKSSSGLLLEYISQGETVPSLPIPAATPSPTQHGPGVAREVDTKARRAENYLSLKQW